jgi:hypothetical protein
MATRKTVSKTLTRAKTPAAPPKAAKRSPAAAAAKSAKAAKPAKAPKAAAAPAPAKAPKLVRDSFTIPKNEYAVLADLKQRAARLDRPAKKSEILRAGIAALSAMADASFLSTLNAVPSLKTGRPKDDAAAP